MKRTGSSNKFIRFFRPSFHLEQMISDDHSVSDYSTSYGRRSSEKWGSDEDEFYPRLSKRKKFSRAIKSIFHSPRMRSEDCKSRSRFSDSPTRVPSLTWTESTDEEDYDSITEEFGTSSSSTSSGSGWGSDSETPSTTTRKPVDPEPERKRAAILAMILLLVVCLAVTVLGGKLLGLALTLICVYLVPRRWGVVGKGEQRRSSETECRKERMVMGGMVKMLSYRRLNLEKLIRFREIRAEM
ncbi:hypothetical protein LINPERPRIM_LOCUS45368 [Linum perenne]